MKDCTITNMMINHTMHEISNYRIETTDSIINPKKVIEDNMYVK